MTPRELIASEIARQYPASADGPTLADRILTRLRYAGFVVVPRVATEAMINAWYILLPGETAQRPREPVNAWAAMVAAAEQP